MQIIIGALNIIESLIIQEMKNQKIMKHYLTLIRIVIILNSAQNNKHCQRYGGLEI